jgi:hypothetical protein
MYVMFTKSSVYVTVFLQIEAISRHNSGEFIQVPTTFGPGSSVGKATGYGLYGLGIESPVGARFFAQVQTGPGAHPVSCTRGTGSFPGLKRPERGADYPPPSCVEVKKG